MNARRSALRAAFDGDDAPVEAFERLRSLPGHEDEARGLLAQFWDRRAMRAPDAVRRVLYALQARVVDDDDDRRRTAASAMAALGPLLKARHVGEGTLLGCDAGTVLLRGSGWVRAQSLESGGWLDVPTSDGGSALADAARIVTWGDDLARVWDFRDGAATPVASLTLLAGEVPLSFAGSGPGGCVLTNAGRVWRVGESSAVTAGPGLWSAGSINPACDRAVLRGTGIASFRRRGRAWMGEPFRPPGKAGVLRRTGVLKVEACAARAPRCLLVDPAGGVSVWDFGPSPARRLVEGLDCDAGRLSPDGTRLFCGGPHGSSALIVEGEAGGWTRTDLVLPPLRTSFLEDSGAICGQEPANDPPAPPSTDRSDVLLFAGQACPSPPAVEHAWAAIRMVPEGTGAVFTYPAVGGSANTGFFGFDAKGESLAAASNAWFGARKDERLLEHDATSSAGNRSYELAGAPFDPAAALAEPEHASSVKIEQAFFVSSPEPSLVLEIAYAGGAAPAPLLRVVARWDLRGKRFCGPPVPGAITTIAPGGDAVAIDGRLHRMGACPSGFEATEPTAVVAIGPAAARWIVRDGDSLRLEGGQGAPLAIPQGGGDAAEAQVAFAPGGDRFFVRTPRSLCKWTIRDEGALDLDGCRWSAVGWASDAAWAAADKTGETILVFDQTPEGAALRELFGSRDGWLSTQSGGNLACTALPTPDERPPAVLQAWEERLGHRFKDQATPPGDTTAMVSSEIVP
jgi:hypothetical protein